MYKCEEYGNITAKLKIKIFKYYKLGKYIDGRL